MSNCAPSLFKAAGDAPGGQDDLLAVALGGSASEGGSESGSGSASGSGSGSEEEGERNRGFGGLPRRGGAAGSNGSLGSGGRPGRRGSAGSSKSGKSKSRSASEERANELSRQLRVAKVRV